MTENEKYYIALHIANKKYVMSVKTNWDDFENNKKIMKGIHKSFDGKTKYIMSYLQVVLQNDKNILLILENLQFLKHILIIFLHYYSICICQVLESKQIIMII
jgi:hypothetical protein